jgi:hypothetical protein
MRLWINGWCPGCRYRWEVTVASGWDSRKEDRRLFHRAVELSEWAISAVTYLRTFCVVERRDQDELKNDGDGPDPVRKCMRPRSCFVSTSTSPKPVLHGIMLQLSSLVRVRGDIIYDTSVRSRAAHIAAQNTPRCQRCELQMRVSPSHLSFDLYSHLGTYQCGHGCTQAHVYHWEYNARYQAQQMNCTSELGEHDVDRKG